MNPWPTWYIPRFCMLMQNLVVAVGSVLVSICTSHSPWIQQNSPRTSHFLCHVWHLMSHTEEPSFHLLNGIQKILDDEGKISNFESLQWSIGGVSWPREGFFFLILTSKLWLPCCNLTCQSCISKSAFYSRNWDLLTIKLWSREPPITLAVESILPSDFVVALGSADLFLSVSLSAFW